MIERIALMGLLMLIIGVVMMCVWSVAMMLSIYREQQVRIANMRIEQAKRDARRRIHQWGPDSGLQPLPPPKPSPRAGRAP